MKLEQLDAVCDHYEQEWKQHGPQDLLTLIRSISPISIDCLWELIQIDMEYRWRRPALGIVEHHLPSQPIIDDYVKLCDSNSIDLQETFLPICEIEVPMAVLETEIRLRRQSRFPTSMKEFQSRYPSLTNDQLSEVSGWIKCYTSSEAQDSFEFLKQTAPSAEDFAVRLMTSGIVTRATIQSIWRTLSRDSRTTFGLAEALGQRGKLTPFQARCMVGVQSYPLVLGRYILRDKLGEGGMGRVYLAMHQSMKRLVAIKVIAEELVHEREVQKRFAREIEAAARLSHPHIVTAYDAGVCRNAHYLVMEYVPGIDLAQRVRDSGPLSIRDALNIVRQTAEGLAFAHDRGIVHRDIKPSNLLLDSNQSVKILDFGLAMLTLTHDSSLTKGLTQSGLTVGTIDYMAPEQAADASLADPRSDVYSLGCTLHFLLTGRPLYGGTTVSEKLTAHRESRIPRLSVTLDGIVGHRIESMLNRMLAKKPCDRFSTMHEVVKAIQDTIDCLDASRHRERLIELAKCRTTSKRSPSVVFAADHTNKQESLCETMVLSHRPRTINESIDPSRVIPIRKHPQRFVESAAQRKCINPWSWFRYVVQVIPIVSKTGFMRLKTLSRDVSNDPDLPRPFAWIDVVLAIIAMVTLFAGIGSFIDP